MSDFEQNSPQSPYQTSGPVWSVAAFATFACLLSVLGAKLLSHWIDSDSATSVAYERAMRDVAANAAQAKSTQTYSIVRSLGVDGITTATIPHLKASPVSPCGDDRTPNSTAK